MLNNIRRFSKTIFAKILIVIIIIPFVFWGMGGVFNRGNTSNIAKINNHSISAQDFLDYLNTLNLNPDLVKDNINDNIIEKLLSGLISKTLVQLEIKNLGISISEKSLIRKIKKDKNFLDEQNNFSRVKYEKFLLLNNITAPSYEFKLQKNELQKKLFLYIHGGVKSPYFIINKIYKEEAKKIDIDFINMENVYKKKEYFTTDEIHSYINKNKEQLEEDYIDFQYVKLTPQIVTGSEEFNELYFKKIDELDNKIADGQKINELIKEFKIQPIIKSNYISNKENNKIEEKIYKQRNGNKIQLVDENDFYLLYEINKINKILPSNNDKKFLAKIRNNLYENSKYEYNKEILREIVNKKFNNYSFEKLSKNHSVQIKNTKLNSLNDNSKFSLNSVKLLYSLPLNAFTLIADDNQNVYLAKIKKIDDKNIQKNSDLYTNYINKSNINMKDNINSTYDYFLNNKYKIKINQKTLERVKNYFR